jgi:hypothetical protein
MIKMDGKPFTGVTYNQGAYAGNRGHLAIKGQLMCKTSMNLHANNRIWNRITSTANLENIANQDNTCKQCSKKVLDLINQARKNEVA